MAKKLWERMQEDINRNKEASEAIRQEANQQFNNLVSQKGEFDTSKHTTTIGDIRKAYKGSSNYNTVKDSLNEYAQNNSPSIWERMQNFMNDSGAVTQNFGLGLMNGIKSFQQTVNQRISENEVRRAKLFEEADKKMVETEQERGNNINLPTNKLAQMLSSENLEKIGEETIQKFQKEKEENQKKMQENANSTNSELAKKIASDIAPSVGQMLPGFVPGVGAVYMSGSATGQYYDDAIQRGMNKEEAKTYSGLMGLAEGATEMIGIGQLTKAGKTAKNLIKGVGKEEAKSVGKEGAKQLLKHYGIGIADNVMQESMIEPIQELTSQAVSGKSNWDNMGQRMLQSGINGGIVSAILGGANIGVQSCTGVVQKMTNNQDISQNELQQAVKDASKELDVSQMVLDSTQQQISKYKDYNTGKNVDNNTQNILNQAENIINQNNVPNLQQEQTQNQQTLPTQQINQNEVANINEEKLDNITNNKKILYHGTENNINGKYSTNEGRKSKNSFGEATYLTENKGVAKQYGSNIYENKLNDNSNIINIEEKSNVTANDLDKITNLLNKYGIKSSNNGEYIETDKGMIDPLNRNIYKQIIQTVDKSNINPIMKELGIDGIYNPSTGTYAIYNQDIIENNQQKNKIAQNRDIEQVEETEKNLNKSSFSFDKINSKIGSDSNINKLTDNGIVMTYVHMKNQNTQNYGNTYGQNIEPAGQYINVDTMQGKYKVPGAEYGTIQFNNPLILDHINTGETGWKKTLSDMFNNKTGKELSNSIKKAGYDGIITIDEDGYYNEVVNLNGKKLDNVANNEETLYNNSNESESGINESRTNKETSNRLSEERNVELDETVRQEQRRIQELYRNYKTDIKSARTEVENYIKEDITSRLPISKTKTESFVKDIIKNEKATQEDVYNFLKNNNEYKYKSVDEEVRNIRNYIHNTSFNLSQNELSELRYTYGKLPRNIKYSNNGISIDQFYEELAGQYPDYFDKNEVINPIDRTIDIIEFMKNNKTENILIQEVLTDDELNDLANKILANKQGYDETKNIIKEEYNNQRKTLLPTNNIQENQNNIPTNKTLNPTEIANLKPENMNTTPELPTKDYARGNKQSNFLSNITTDSKFLNEDLRQEMAKEESIRYYQGITNKETLERAYNSLNENGEKETINWFSKDDKNVSAEDVAKGWILLKQYQDSGDYQSAVEVAKKMRDIGTEAGQAVQAYNIMSRLTPEGMFYYAQSELSEAYNKAVEGKSKKWIEANKDKFNLTPEETNFIKDTMNEVAQMEDGYEKKTKIAEIQKVITDKIPPTAGQSIKAWMRISMLFNPKTQVRNIGGNAVILPVNIGSDVIASGVDRMIAKKTGVRTTGNINLKNYAKGFSKGLYESYNDFKKGINTRNIEGNRFEVSEGRSFNNKGIGKSLNRVDNLLSFMLDAGDRGFYEATFINSINNQMVLNNTKQVTQDMIDIATNEALQRTWQDNNNYTKSVLKIRNILNSVNVKGYGFGDVIIPFAKTPANLTKAIVDYSPIGLTKTLTLDAKKFTNSLNNGQYTPQLQHKFVQNLGKGMAGSLLYVLGYGLAQSGTATGESDDDKDVKNFMKNSLGISSYSIKIGNKSFTYDWAQPVAVPLSIATNFVKYSKDNPDAKVIEKAIKSLDIGTEQLLQQSFMESLNTVLNGNGTTMENLTKSVMDLPARAIPTFSKQIADMVDGTQRTTFEYDKPVESAINSVKSKIPIISKSLPVSRDTFGNEIEKYGGENNVFNVMFNPANVNKGKLSKAGQEVYRLYQETGEKEIFPTTAPYYINNKGEKVNMTAEQRSEYQKVTGQYTEKAITELLSNTQYKELSNEKKSKLISEIIKDSSAKAKHDILNIEADDAKAKRELIDKITTKVYYDFNIKTDGMKKEGEKDAVILNSNYSDKAKKILYENTTGKDDDFYNIVAKNSDLDINEYLDFKIQRNTKSFEADKKKNGKAIIGSAKKKVYNYVNENISGYENRLLILGNAYKLSNKERNDLTTYINQKSKSNEEAIEIFKKLSKNYTYKNGKVYYK